MSSRVLIVDDDSGLRLLLGYHFRRDGFEVLTAADGEEALATLDAVSIDVVLSDLNMPGTGGQGLVKALRQRGLTLPVVLMSGSDAGADVARGLGGVPFVPKTAGPVQIIAVVRAARDAAGRRDATLSTVACPASPT